jgi:hypothetical protein
MLNVIAPLLGAVLTALAGYAIAYINKRKKQIETTTDSQIANKYIEMISDTIISCVKAINQTYVDDLKKANAFTAENQKEALKECYNKVIGLLSEDTITYIKTAFGDVETYLTTKIEAEVKTQKTA